MPRSTHTALRPGQGTADELVADTPSGVYVAALGGGSAEPATGRFSFVVTEAYVIERGCLGRPLTRLRLVGRTLDTLRNIDAVAADTSDAALFCGKRGQWLPMSFDTPALRLRDARLVGARR